MLRFDKLYIHQFQNKYCNSKTKKKKWDNQVEVEKIPDLYKELDLSLSSSLPKIDKIKLLSSKKEVVGIFTRNPILL